MPKVLGVGGIFFRSRNPGELQAWYQRWLKLPISDSHAVYFSPQSMPKNSFTVWAPFPQDTAYFGAAEQQFMINLIVDDLNAVLERVREGGATTIGEVREYDYGRFGWFKDPDGHRVELWECTNSQHAHGVDRTTRDDDSAL